MNVPAVLLVQSIPFAGLAMATLGEAGDLFAIVYIVAFGLLMSLVAMSGDQAAVLQAMATIGQFD